MYNKLVHKLLTAIFIVSLVFVSPATISYGFVQSLPANKHKPFVHKLDKKSEAWVRDTLKSMTLDEKIGQMMAADATFFFRNRESEEYKRLVHNVVDNKVGSVIMFRSEVWPTAIMTNRLQELAKVPLLISADLEMGMGMRFDGTQWWPPNMAVAATGDTKWARLQGEATARQARAVGVNWLFAPSADVNNNPDNPVINTRSYGENPNLVADYTKAFIEGAQNAGALACAKHFPGHGDTAIDSHIGLPVINVNKQRLNDIELIPFRAAIDAGIGSIMSAHISLPLIDDEAAAPVRSLSDKEASSVEFLSSTEVDGPRVTVPVTLSKKVLTDILRNEMDFDGIIVTDSMGMAGVSARYTPGEAAVRAVKAGADMILKSPDVDAAIAGVKQAVLNNEIPESQITRSAERILRAKAALDLHTTRIIDLNDVDVIVSNTSFNDIAQQIADRSITVIRDEQKLIPLNIDKKSGNLLHIAFTEESDKLLARGLFDELKVRVPRVESIILDSRTSDAELNKILNSIDENKFSAIVLSLAVRARSGKGSVALPENGKRLAAGLMKKKSPLIVVSFGNPYILNAIPEAQTYVIAYGFQPFSQKAAIKALFGEIEITGKAPVVIK